jgi:hypothetical protein
MMRRPFSVEGSSEEEGGRGRFWSPGTGWVLKWRLSDVTRGCINTTYSVSEAPNQSRKGANLKPPDRFKAAWEI